MLHRKLNMRTSLMRTNLKSLKMIHQNSTDNSIPTRTLFPNQHYLSKPLLPYLSKSVKYNNACMNLLTITLKINSCTNVEYG